MLIDSKTDSQTTDSSTDYYSEDASVLITSKHWSSIKVKYSLDSHSYTIVSQTDWQIGVS